MYFSQVFRGKSREEIKKDIEKEGFNPLQITDKPGFVYHKHHHPETKLLVFLEGSMDVTTEGITYHCVRGDKLVIPGNTMHQAVVGKKGCIFYWSEKIF